MAEHAAVWDLFSFAFVYPDADWRPLFDEKMAKVLAIVEEEAFIAVLNAWHEALLETDAQPLTVLQSEYTRLFISGYPKVACPPYQSVYRERTLLGDSAFSVYQVFETWGVEMASNEMSDHIAVLLEFMAYLSRLYMLLDDQRTQERAHVRQALTDFWQQHLLDWLPKFAEDLVAEAELPFYRQSGKALQALLVVVPSWETQ